MKTQLDTVKLDRNLDPTPRLRGIPIWIRAPKRGSEFFSGFSRSKLYDLAAKKLIRSVSVKEPGQVSGTRLFYLDSILEYIERVASEQTQETTQTETDPNLIEV